MITGKTKTGFCYALDDDVLDDWELLANLREIDKGNTAAIVDTANMLLGEDMPKLIAHVKGTGKRARASKVTAEIVDIIEGVKGGKNS